MAHSALTVTFKVMNSLLLFIIAMAISPTGSSSPRVLMISFDGFRHDYLDMAERAGRNISAFREIWSGGVRAEYVKNVFTTRTFPNHLTLVTGLYEESHGIVDNRFWDPDRRAVFSLTHPEDQWSTGWFGGEPVWATVERHGLASGVFFWPGSTAPVAGRLPQYSFGLYSSTPPLTYRINRVLSWLTSAESAASLCLLYFPEPDITGHEMGPNHPAILDRLEELNAGLAYLLGRLRGLPQLAASLNILLVSDHGMTEVASDRLINLDNLLPGHLYRTHGEESGPIWGLWPIREGNS